MDSPTTSAGPLRVTAYILAGLLLAVVGFVVAVRAVHAGEVLPGVTVEGVDVGGLGRADARAVLDDLVTARRNDPVTFTYDGREFAYTPGDTAYSAEVETAVDAAMQPGRGDDLLTSSWRHVAALWHRPVEVALPDDIAREEVRRFVERVAAEVDQQPFAGEVTADPETLDVTARPPVDGEIVRRRDAVAAASDAIRSAGPDTVELPVEIIPTHVDPASVEVVAEQFERALARPLDLTTPHGTEARVRPRDIARLISSQTVGPFDDRHLELVVTTAAVEDVIGPPTIEVLEQEPVDASFELISGLETFDDKDDATWTPGPAELELVPGEDGFGFVPSRTAEQLTGALTAGQHQVELDLEVVRPEVTAEEARSWRMDQLIGTFTTYHACCQNRVRNIQRMADMVRGTVIAPGDVFSINEIVGERTVAKGFFEDGVIVRGEFVKEVGGGVSQFATTTFNAAFFAGMEFEEYKAHSYYISRYPMGREATLYWPYLDLRWRNVSDEGVYVHTSYTPTSITVSLFGHVGDRSVSARHGEPFRFTQPKTLYRENNALPQGARRVVQQGDIGFDVNVWRRVGSGEEQRFFTRYDAQLEIIERNT